MNEQQRARLREIAALLEEFARKPAPEALKEIRKRLRELIRAVQAPAAGIETTADGRLMAPGLDSIELTGLRAAYGILKHELTVLSAAGPSQALTTLCGEQARAMRMLAEPPPQPGTGRAQAPGPYDEPVPFTTLAMQACVIDLAKNECFLSNQPNARADVYGFTTSIALMRNSGVSFLTCIGFEGLSAQELSWLCAAARRIFAEFSIRLPSLSCNVEVSAGARKLYLRVVLTADRAMFLTCESRSLVRVPPSGTTVPKLKAALMDTFHLVGITELDGAVWTVDELLEIQAAFAKIPIPDRGALADLRLVRARRSQVNRPDADQHRGYYDTSNHTFTILDGAFAELTGFTGSGPDASRYTHFVILHEIGHVVENWYRVKTPGVPLAGALTLFVAKVKALGVQPFTIYSWNNWPTKPFEFFAEAYTYFLNDPGAMEFVSPQLLAWFKHGDYREEASPRPGLSNAQTTLLEGALAGLDGLCDAFTAAQAADQSTVAALRRRCADVTAQLGALVRTLEDAPHAAIEHTILGWVAHVLDGEVAGPLSPSGGGLPNATAFPALKAVCQGEHATLAALLKPVSVLLVEEHKRVTGGVCSIASVPSGSTIVGGMASPYGDFEALPLTRAMSLLRDFGCRSLKLDGCDALPMTEVAWLCNAAAKVFVDCGSRFALSVDVPVSLPRRGRTLLVRFVFFASHGLRIRLQGIAAPLAQPPALDDLRRLLLGRYGLSEITTSDGGVWTPGELAQVCDAFARIPVDDLPALRGCRLVRKGGMPGHGGWFDTATRSLVVAGAGFPLLEQAFVGDAGEVFPISRWTVLRIVGLAVALHDWSPDDLPPSPTPPGLASFITVTSHLPISGFTTGIRLSPHTWPDLFADAYALFLCEPQVLLWISRELRNWFAGGSYRLMPG